MIAQCCSFIALFLIFICSETSAQGTAIGGDQHQLPASSVNSHLPSPPSYTQALALPPLAPSRAKIYVANRNETKESPGYTLSNPGFKARFCENL